VSDQRWNLLQEGVQLVTARSKRIFLPAEWKRVLRVAGWKAGMRFIDNWLPRRWDEGYARRLGYSGKGGSDTIPYYEKGKWIKNATRAYPRVTATGKTFQIKIKVPVGHALTPKTARDFVRVSDQERNDVALAFVAAVEDIIKSGTSVKRTVGYGTVIGRKGKEVKKKVKGWTRAISARDKSLSRFIAAKGGFRGGAIASDMEARAFTLGKTRRMMIKKSRTMNQLKRKHQEWARTAGGAAGPTGQQILTGQTTSRTYAGSRRQKHAEAQRRYRDKYRRSRAGDIGAKSFISQSI